MGPFVPRVVIISATQSACADICLAQIRVVVLLFMLTWGASGGMIQRPCTARAL